MRHCHISYTAEEAHTEQPLTSTTSVVATPNRRVLVSSSFVFYYCLNQSQMSGALRLFCGRFFLVVRKMLLFVFVGLFMFREPINKSNVAN